LPLEKWTIRRYSVEPKQEVRDQIQWIGWRSILPPWGRIIKLMLKKPQRCEAIKGQFDSPLEAMDRFATRFSEDATCGAG